MAWYDQIVPELIALLSERRYEEALAVPDRVRPPKPYREPSPYFDRPFGGSALSELRALMETKPEVLNFLSPAELDAVQVAAGVGYCVGATRKRSRFIPGPLEWTHDMSIDAAIHNLVHDYLSKRVIPWDLVAEGRITAKIHHSADGPCAVCVEAGKRVYQGFELPVTPVPGCLNNKDGCRCSTSIYAKKGLS